MGLRGECKITPFLNVYTNTMLNYLLVKTSNN